MVEYLLIFAGTYGLSGAVLKMVRPFYSYTQFIDFHRDPRNTEHLEDEPSLELTRMATDFFAFSLIGMGFIMALISAFDTFPIEVIPTAFLVALQNICVWLAAYDFYTIVRTGQAKGKHLVFIVFVVSGILVLPLLALTAVTDTLVLGSLPPLWFRAITSIFLLVPTFQYYFAWHYVVKADKYQKERIMQHHF